jgi:predicted RNA-binding protein YlxR (DUF448 family)
MPRHEPEPVTGPLRTCVGCRTRAPAAELLRVVARDGVAVPDANRREPGRGAHLHLTLECLEHAERRRALPRALRVEGPLDLSRVRGLLSPSAERAERAERGTR